MTGDPAARWRAGRPGHDRRRPSDRGGRLLPGWLVTPEAGALLGLLPVALPRRTRHGHAGDLYSRKETR